MKTGLLVLLVLGVLVVGVYVTSSDHVTEEPVTTFVAPAESIEVVSHAAAASTALLDEASSIISTTTARTGVALVDLSTSSVELAGEDTPFTLASVGKLYVLAAFLAGKEATGAPITAYELVMLEDMVQYSDNDAATALWYEAGGYSSLSALLAAWQLPGVGEPGNGSWGSITATAEDVGLLLEALYNGRILDSEKTALAMGLLSGVAEWQAWGISAGAAEDAMVLLKNGWYPDEDGWRIHSAGIVLTTSGAYALVILSDSQVSYEAGIASIEEIAVAVNGQLSVAGSVAFQP